MPEQKSTAFQPQYATTSSLLSFVVFLGWAAAAVAGISAFVSIIIAFHNQSSIGLISVVIALVAAINGVFVVAIGQIGQTMIDTANTNAEMLFLMKRGTIEIEGTAEDISMPIVEKQEIAFSCPFCDQGMYRFERCPKCGNTIDKMVLDAHQKKQ